MAVGTAFQDGFFDMPVKAADGDDNGVSCFVATLDTTEENNSARLVFRDPNVCTAVVALPHQGFGKGVAVGYDMLKAGGVQGDGLQPALAGIESFAMLLTQGISSIVQDETRVAYPIAAASDDNFAVYMAVQETLQQEVERGSINWVPAIQKVHIKTGEVVWTTPILTTDGYSVLTSVAYMSVRDTVLVAGSSNGYGSALGSGYSSQDWDGFLTKVDPQTGVIDDVDGVTARHSVRIQTQPQMDDYVHAICVLDDKVYVVGTTEGKMEGTTAGGAFIIKYDIDTLQVVWKRQISGNVQGKHCGVSEEFVYIGGDVGKGLSIEEGVKQAYLQDVFVSQLSSLDGSISWTRQFGSHRDDSLESLVVDKAGNAVVCGNSMEHAYLPSSLFSPANDVFILSLDKLDGAHQELVHDVIAHPSTFDGPCIDCPGYVALSGADKLDRIWRKIAAYEYPQLPENWLYKRTNPTAMEMINDFPDKTRVNMVFDRVSDERPPNFPRIFHEYGSLAKIAFEPSSTAHNFTGLYSEGNDHGIIRITFCAPFDGELNGQRVPLVFAAKFFRDGIHSSNIPTCEGPDRGWPGRNPAGFSVFRHPLHTTAMVPPPIDDFSAIAQNQTGTLSIADNTWYSTDGAPIDDPLAPLIVHFFPNDALNTKDAYEEDFRKELPALPVNTTLYTAYTPVDEEGNPTICICHSTPEGGIPCFNWESLSGTCKMVELGSIVTRSTFINSDYGDNAVFFKHCRSCQEDRKYCKYNQPLPQTDSTFRKSADLNGTCISRRQDVVNYDATCPFLAGASNAVVGLELMETTDYCSTPDERALEKMCPFAKALHPSISSHGARYPLTNEDRLRNCEIEIIDTAASKGLATAAKFPLVSMGCCRVSGEYFEESMKDVALQSLCNMEDCRAKFEMAFPEIALETECASVDPVIECKFEIQAGPSMLPINLGFVTDACCTAATSHATGGDETNIALGTICEEKSCIAAYDSLFQQGQIFANPGSSATLEESCASMSESKEEPVDGEGSGSSAIALPSGRILALIVAACMSSIV